MSGGTGDARLAVVTGGGGGIGLAVARRLAAAGTRVVIAGRSTDRLEEGRRAIAAAGGEVDALAADVRDPDSVAALAEAVARRHGTVDALVANSGVAGTTAPLWETPVDAWADTIQTNLTGPFLCCRAFLPAMVARGAGAVVVIGSATGKRPMAGRTPYAASKAGLIGLVRTLALEAAPHGVRVNLVSPGPTAGRRLRDVIASQAVGRGLSVAAAEREFLRSMPMERLVGAGEVADCVHFLVSDAAGAITGEDLNVSGGWCMQ